MAINGSESRTCTFLNGVDPSWSTVRIEQIKETLDESLSHRRVCRDISFNDFLRRHSYYSNLSLDSLYDMFNYTICLRIIDWWILAHQWERIHFILESSNIINVTQFLFQCLESIVLFYICCPIPISFCGNPPSAEVHLKQIKQLDNLIRPP